MEYALRLEPLVRQLADSFATRIASTGATFEVREPLAMPLADATLVRHILTNPIDNALAHPRPQMAPRIRLSAARERDLVLLQVADNGAGIAPEHQRRVFEVFEPLEARSRSVFLRPRGKIEGVGCRSAARSDMRRLLEAAHAVQSLTCG